MNLHDNFSNVGTSTTPLIPELSVAAMVALATSWTSSGLTPAAPKNPRRPSRDWFNPAMPDISISSGFKCGLSFFENISPGRTNIDRRP